jgi:hypothetical protein
MSDLSELEAEMQAAFEIQLARSEGLRALVEYAGRQIVWHAWRLGWATGKQAGLEKAQQVLDAEPQP